MTSIGSLSSHLSCDLSCNIVNSLPYKASRLSYGSGSTSKPSIRFFKIFNISGHLHIRYVSSGFLVRDFSCSSNSSECSRLYDYRFLRGVGGPIFFTSNHHVFSDLSNEIGVLA